MASYLSLSFWPCPKCDVGCDTTVTDNFIACFDPVLSAEKPPFWVVVEKEAPRRFKFKMSMGSVFDEDAKTGKSVVGVAPDGSRALGAMKYAFDPAHEAELRSQLE